MNNGIIKFTVWFEIFGKKMKTEVYATSVAEAKQKVKDKIIFHKIEGYNTLDNLLNIFGMKK